MGMRRMKPPLPLPSAYTSADAYIDGLLSFVAESPMIHTLCGGVHILDFLTREPDHFSTILPQAWRDWLSPVPIQTILDLLLREDLEKLSKLSNEVDAPRWRGSPLPPASLLEYIRTVRNHCLDRSFVPNAKIVAKKLSRNIGMGMKPKKAHEVEHFASFIDTLMREVTAVSHHNITHILDFGSGQNYLGRVLASPLYQRHIIALESRLHNIEGAKSMDVNTKLAKKHAVWRNKKLFRAEGYDNSQDIQRNRSEGNVEAREMRTKADYEPDENLARIQYIEKEIVNGNLDDVLDEVQLQIAGASEGRSFDDPSTALIKASSPQPEVIVISLHSCGNLIHHGLRSLVLNPTVKAVAMVGCCYNLTTERLGPPSEKLPNLRSRNKRVRDCALACDPHGFPMSERLVNYAYRGRKGLRMNITARMMAVQAPLNWTEAECDSFFTRHFYRALFQRILVDRGMVPPGGSSEAIGESGGEPVTLGGLRKSCYVTFIAYVRGAIEKLQTLGHGESVSRHLSNISDQEITAYLERFKHKKHELSIVWSLMAFSAGVVESLIVADRWLFLREQSSVEECWVQTVFDYSLSPRNLAVVGIKA